MSVWVSDRLERLSQMRLPTEQVHQRKMPHAHVPKSRSSRRRMLSRVPGKVPLFQTDEILPRRLRSRSGVRLLFGRMQTGAMFDGDVSAGDVQRDGSAARRLLSPMRRSRRVSAEKMRAVQERIRRRSTRLQNVRMQTKYY